MKEILTKLVDGQDLSRAEMQSALTSVMNGEATPAQLAALVTALRIKGETVVEVTAAAEVMRRFAVFIDAGAGRVIDTCGTGGDGSNTFNISTTAAFVAAGAGVTVAKHGNRAVSSLCGSADVLEALGVDVGVDPAIMEQAIQEEGIGFLFAPKVHPAMKYAAGPRRELGFRTVFNMLGPLTNPAGATGQVLGVFAPQLTEMFAEVLGELGCRRAYVVHGMDGLDEITLTGETRVSELRDGRVRTYVLNPLSFFPELCEPEDLAGGDPQTNARILRGVLCGEPGPARDIALLNAGAAIAAGERAEDVREGMELARRAIDSGAALAKLEALVSLTRDGGGGPG